MKIVEDYAQRVAKKKVDEKLTERNEEIVINLKKECYKLSDIARIADVSKDFVKKTLSK